VPTPHVSLGVLEPIGGGDPIPLLKDRLVIGRRETCDICLPFSNVSTHHCELILEQGYWKVKDLQSTNGVKVNGERVIEKRVYPGDEVSISKHRYRLDYTPTTSRSADAEVDELHEDIMRFSLLERAGLTKQGDKSKTAARRPAKLKSDEDEAFDLLNVPVAKADEHGEGNDADSTPKPGKSSISLGEEAIEVVSPAASADNLSDEEFMKIVADEEKKKKAQQKKPS
jgi:adenylate cyclase